MDAKGEGVKRIDWIGTVLSSLGLFSLVFGFIEGRKYGWLTPADQFPFWNLGISVIPFFFLAAIIFLGSFVFYEKHFEKRGSPLLKIDTFKNRGFSIGVILLAILALGQFGTFFILPIYLENVLGLSALETGVALLWVSISLFLLGTTSGFLASKINVKYIVSTGMVILSIGVIFLIMSITPDATVLSIAPALIFFGIGSGLSSAQLNNIIISSAPRSIAGEASAISITMRQLGSAIGIALIGAVLANSLSVNIIKQVNADNNLPENIKPEIISNLENIDIESGQINSGNINSNLDTFIKEDVDSALVIASRRALSTGLIFTLIAMLLSFFLPILKDTENHGPPPRSRKAKR